MNERRRALDLPFDARPVHGSAISDIDLNLVNALLPALQPADVLRRTDARPSNAWLPCACARPVAHRPRPGSWSPGTIRRRGCPAPTSNSPIRITWFSDRVEIVSPGGPFGIVNLENFGTGVTDYRNPTLAEVMRGLGYVQRFGAGIPITRRSLIENGNPEPEFIVTPSHVAVTLRRRS